MEILLSKPNIFRFSEYDNRNVDGKASYNSLEIRKRLARQLRNVLFDGVRRTVTDLSAFPISSLFRFLPRMRAVKWSHSSRSTSAETMEAVAPTSVGRSG